MNTQDIFDLVSNHMILQGNRWGNFFRRERKWGYINPENDCERCVKGLFLNKDRSEVMHRENRFVTWVELVEDGIGRSLSYNEKFLLNEAEKIFETERYSRWKYRLDCLARMLELNSRADSTESSKETKYEYCN